jgi:Zn-dependent protease with chaperone function
LFANLFFLILNLLLISSVVDQPLAPLLSHQPGLAFGLFIFTYLFLLGFLYVQSRYLKHKLFWGAERILLLANSEILLFFCFFYFFLGSHRWLMTHFGTFAVTGISAFALIVYFISLFICHLSLNLKPAIKQSWKAVRFLVPFAIPFLLLAFLGELSRIVPFENLLKGLSLKENSIEYSLLVIFFNLGVIIATLIFLPPLAVLIWGCPNLEDPVLKMELTHLCERAHFKHAGFKMWTILHNAMTAAIVGVISRWRYILFTQKLLDNLPTSSIVAILAHEIGHSYYYHLVFYPFILLGMIIAGTLTPLLLYQSLLQPISSEQNFQAFVPFLLFLVFGCAMAIYFRVVFGYFSRIFERQADLHIFKLGIPAEHMTHALNTLGTLGGNIHEDPNWHHYSIRERIDFIQRADRDQRLIAHHSRKVNLSLIVYFFILSLALSVFGYLVF